MRRIDDSEKKNKKDIQWHQAFVVAIQGILIDYSDALEYRLEHPLNEKPLRIDFLVIKKRRETVIKKQIAEIFRLENIVEYKSPTDYLSVNEFHKALARTHLYKALSPSLDIADMTLSFVCSARPRELIRHLRDTPGFAVAEKYPGIFIVTGAMLPVQIIDIRKLSDEENIWLNSLSRDMPEENARWVGSLEKKYGNRIDLGVYLCAVLAANHDKFSKESYRMLNAKTIKIFEELGWMDKWRKNVRLEGRKEGIEKGRLEGIEKGRLEGIEKGRLEGIEKGRWETARAMFAEGDSLEKIARVTGISRRTLKAKLAAQ